MWAKPVLSKVRWLVVPHRLREHVTAVKVPQPPSDTCKIGNVTERLSCWSQWLESRTFQLSNDRRWLLQITVRQVPKPGGKACLKRAAQPETVFSIGWDYIINQRWSNHGGWGLASLQNTVLDVCTQVSSCFHHIHSLFLNNGIWGYSVSQSRFAMDSVCVRCVFVLCHFGPFNSAGLPALRRI